MPHFPMIKAQSLKGESLLLPKEKSCVLILSFDKLQYAQGLNWYNELSKKTDLDIYKIPVLSDRFMLMQDVLFDGIRMFFKEIENSTYPAFINRIDFFEQTQFDENNPVIIKLDTDGAYHSFASPQEYKE